MDMGPCPKLHSDKIRKTFQDARTANPSDPRFAAFEQEYQNNIYAFVDDCDRKIRMSQKRLEKTPEENRRTVDLVRRLGGLNVALRD
jgi:RNA-binding protein Luc7-like 2